MLWVGVVAGFPLMSGVARAQVALPAALVAPAVATSGSGSDADRIAALEKKLNDQAVAIAQAQTAGDNAWMLGGGAGAADDGSRAGAVLRRTGAQEKYVEHDDAELRHDGGDHDPVGGGDVLAGIWQRESVYRWAASMFLRGWGWSRARDAPTIPLQTFMVYQLMFAIITPALITGAFAERMKFSAMLVFMVLWAICVQPDGAHGVGLGGLLNAATGQVPLSGLCRRRVVHVTSGGIRAGDGALPGQANWVSEGGDAATLGGAELYWGVPSVGGLVRVQAGTGAGGPARWRRRRLLRRTLAQRRRRLAGARPSGSATASLRCWARSQVRWRGWWPSLRLRDLCSPMAAHGSDCLPASFCF